MFGGLTFIDYGIEVISSKKDLGVTEICRQLTLFLIF